MFEIVNFEKVNTDWVGSHTMGKAVKPLSDMLAWSLNLKAEAKQNLGELNDENYNTAQKIKFCVNTPLLNVSKSVEICEFIYIYWIFHKLNPTIILFHWLKKTHVSKF